LVVTIAELISAVNISLERAPVASCRAADSDGDGTVRVNELVTAIGRALGGCVS
jgi:hypothetical protein